MVDDLVHTTASEAARRVSPREVDQRRGWFAEWHLLGAGPGERADAEIARILARYPFRDPG